MIAILGLVVLVVFVLAFFVGRTQEKIWMRWGLVVGVGLFVLLYLFRSMLTTH
ncbi:MAG: hypothetical protein M3N19_02270 [Candidatus Eremiobacteraeota bacterium]|nr:hypothetical protein [Candidatus Eremiobacteraeota bacterium]